jgi:predicted GNAT family acetyltransferase
VGPLGCIPESSRGNLSQQDFDGIREWNMTAAIVSHVDPKSDYNVFFVPRFDEPPGSLTGAITPRDWQRNTINVAIVSDAVQGQGLAHELLHFLLNKAKFMDKSGHSNGQNDLMKVNPGQNDILVPKQQANFINPSGWP